MAKVSVSLGINIPIGKDQPVGKDKYDRITPSVTIADIDTEGDVDKQIELAIEAGKKGWRAASEMIAVMIKEELNKIIMEEGK